MGRVRRILLLALLAVAGFALVPIASTATVTNMAYSDLTGSLYLAPTTGTAPKTLFTNDGTTALQALAIAPSGKDVLVATPDTSALALVAVGGGNPVAINGTANATSGGFSPDGKTVVFATSDGIYTVATTGGTAKKLLGTPDGDTDSLPAYSPSGKQVAFARDAFDADGNETVTLELFTIAGATTKDLATDLLTDPAVGGRISFSPDGKTLAYAGGFDNTGIFTVPIGGGTASQLTTDTDLWPSYTPDGTKIFFSRDAGSPGADDMADSPKSSSDNDVDELWSMSATGDSAGVIQQGDYETLVLAPGKTTATSTTTTTGSSTTTTTTGTTTGAKGGPSLTLSISGHRYKASWTGTAPGWKVTLRVGKKTTSVTVKGSVHSHVFIETAKGAVTLTVSATA